jgi:hypothetical protein
VGTIASSARTWVSQATDGGFWTFVELGFVEQTARKPEEFDYEDMESCITAVEEV